MLLPPELKALAAEGPGRHAIDGGRVLFDGLALLAPKADATYRVRAQGLQAGDLRVRCQLRPTRCKRRSPRKRARRCYAA